MVAGVCGVRGMCGFWFIKYFVAKKNPNKKVPNLGLVALMSEYVFARSMNEKWITQSYSICYNQPINQPTKQIRCSLGSDLQAEHILHILVVHLFVCVGWNVFA